MSKKPNDYRKEQITPWEKYVREIVGKGIREMREKKGISAATVAGWIGHTADNLYKIERGDRNRLSLADFVRIARNFGCSMDELIPEEFAAAPHHQDRQAQR